LKFKGFVVLWIGNEGYCYTYCCTARGAGNVSPTSLLNSLFPRRVPDVIKGSFGKRR